jgi:GcrA cell cycle regulator
MNANSLRRRAHHEPKSTDKPADKPAGKPAKEGHRIQREAGNKTASRAGATWSSERITQLRSCVAAGFTCSRIAAEIGVSRNAVIGKMNRLGLSRPRNVLATGPEQKHTWRPKADNVTRLFSQHRILMRLPPEPPPSPESIRNGRGCSLLELSPRSCRWPINEPGTADFCFCGHPQVEGLPYCVGHARIAYKSAARAVSGARV